jgi:hypothetical protein
MSYLCDDTYAKQFRTEYNRAYAYFKSLERLLEHWSFGELDFAPAHPRVIYELRLQAIEDYLTALEVQAAAEHIKLVPWYCLPQITLDNPSLDCWIDEYEFMQLTDSAAAQ